MTTLCRGLGAVCVLLLLACAFTPLPDLLARWTGAAPRLAPADAIVVLGAGVLPDGSLGSLSLRRTVLGIRLARRGLAPLLLFTGPPPHDGKPAEPAVRAALARELGVPASAVLTASAWTTGEEATQARALLAERGVRRVLLVSESQHLTRAGRLFQRAGFEVFPAPADGEGNAGSPEARLDLMRGILEELVARLVYRLAGKA